MRRPLPAAPSAPAASALAVLALFAVLAAGCGSGGGSDGSGADGAADRSSDTATSSADPSFAQQDAQDIEDQAKAATTGVSSLHLAGTLTTGGQQETLDLQLDDAGNCTGSIGIGAKGTAQILGVDGKYWFKPDDDFWHAFAEAKADQIIAAVKDRYVVNPDLSDVCDLDGFFKDDSDSDGTATVDGTTTVDGQETVKVTTTDTKGTKTTGYVLTSDPHYVVKLEAVGAEPGTFTLGQFGEPLDVTAPAADDQVTQAELGAGS